MLTREEIRNARADEREFEHTSERLFAQAELAIEMREAIEFVIQEYAEKGFHESRQDFDESYDRLLAVLKKVIAL